MFIFLKSLKNNEYMQIFRIKKSFFLIEKVRERKFFGKRKRK